MALRDTLDPTLSASLGSAESIANAASFWSACLGQLERELPAQQFNTWIKGLRLEADGSPDQLNLLAPNRFVLQWVRERYLAQIQELSQQFYPVPVTINLGLVGTPDIADD